MTTQSTNNEGASQGAGTQTTNSTQNQAPDGAGEGGQSPAGEGNARERRENARFADVQRERDEALERLSKLEKAEQDRQRKKAEEEGDFQKQIELKEQERSKLSEQLEKYRRKDVDRKIQDALRREAKDASEDDVRGAYLLLVDREGLDRYPAEDKLPEAIKDRVALLKERKPELFEPKKQDSTTTPQEGARPRGGPAKPQPSHPVAPFGNRRPGL